MAQRGALIGLLLALSACPLNAAESAAAAPAEKLPVEAFAQLPFVEHPVISPDGTRWAGLFGVNGTQGILILNIIEKPMLAARLTMPDRTNVRWLRWANADNVLIGLDTLQSVEGATGISRGSSA